MFHDLGVKDLIQELRDCRPKVLRLRWIGRSRGWLLSSKLTEMFVLSIRYDVRVAWGLNNTETWDPIRQCLSDFRLFLFTILPEAADGHQIWRSSAHPRWSRLLVNFPSTKSYVRLLTWDYTTFLLADYDKRAVSQCAVCTVTIQHLLKPLLVTTPFVRVTDVVFESRVSEFDSPFDLLRNSWSSFRNVNINIKKKTVLKSAWLS